MASLAPGDGDPLYKTDEALSSLTDCVTDVIIQLSDSGDDNIQILTFSNNTGKMIFQNKNHRSIDIFQAAICWMC